jgi:hypothetical protein
MPHLTRTSLSRVASLAACVALLGPAAAFGQAPSPPAAASVPASARLELRAGDRVILIGNTLAERQQYFNHFESLLLAAYPTLNLSIRNLGWSADTLTLQPRPLNFGDAAQHLTTWKADVMLAFFGANESFEGDAGVPQFEKDLEAYVAKHRAATYNGKTPPRIVLVSPIAHEKLARLVHVDVEGRNRELARYTEAMRRVAARLEVPFADVYTPTLQAMVAAKAPLTVNGMHLNDEGDRVFARILFDALALKPGTVMPRGKAFTDLRASVNEKNRLFFLRWRPLNAEYVVGRRVDPFGSVSFPPEMQQLDKMLVEHDRRIWRQARLAASAPAAPARPGAARPGTASSPAGGVR